MCVRGCYGVVCSSFSRRKCVIQLKFCNFTQPFVTLFPPARPPPPPSPTNQCQELDVKDTLHNAFAAMGALSVVNAVSEASSKICAHSSSSSTAAHLAMGATNAPQALRSLQAQRQRKEQLLPRRYQSAFQLAADKLDAHRCMVQVLQSSVSKITLKSPLSLSLCSILPLSHFPPPPASPPPPSSSPLLTGFKSFSLI